MSALPVSSRIQPSVVVERLERSNSKTKSFRYLQWRYEGTLFPSYFGGGLFFSLHKPYPYSLYHGEDSFILGYLFLEVEFGVILDISRKTEKYAHEKGKSYSNCLESVPQNQSKNIFHFRQSYRHCNLMEHKKNN